MIRAPIAALLVTALVLCLGASTARAATDPGLKRAQDRFQYGDYQGAVAIATRLLDEGRLTSETELVEANRILALSYYYLDRKEEARSAVVRLLSIDPDYRLDPFFYPPKLVEFFDTVKAENETLLAPIRAQKARIEEERRRAEAARLRLLKEERRRRQAAEARERATSPVTVERTVTHHPYLLNWLPFGAGQFQNGQAAKGGTLAGLELLTGGASLLGYLVTANLRTCQPLTLPSGSLGQPDQEIQRCGIPPASQGLARNMTRLKWGAALAFWALVAYGIVDAHLHWSPVVTRVVRQPRVPRATPEPAGASPTAGPTGARVPDTGSAPSSDTTPAERPAPPPTSSTPGSPPPAPGTGQPEASPAPRSPGTSLHLAPLLAPGAAGASLIVTF